MFMYRFRSRGLDPLATRIGGLQLRHIKPRAPTRNTNEPASNGHDAYVSSQCTRDHFPTIRISLVRGSAAGEALARSRGFPRYPRRSRIPPPRTRGSSFFQRSRSPLHLTFFRRHPKNLTKLVGARPAAALVVRVALTLSLLSVTHAESACPGRLSSPS